ncbi:MAG: metal-dependent hydrolase [candidate division WOR-3 bacterium]
MKLRYLGHSAVRIEGRKTVLIDPFLKDNPLATEKPKDIKEADVIVVTHDHADHLGDAFEIAKKTGAIIVSQHEIAVAAQSKGLKAEGMNIGGPVVANGVKVWLTPAFHTSSSGAPTGCVVEMPNGKRIYHAGDTGLFGDMALIGEMLKPDAACIPIGGRYTMDVVQAAKAVELIKAPVVIPIHYNTWPIIQADPEEFKRLVGGKAQVVILNPGEAYTFVRVGL